MYWRRRLAYWTSGFTVLVGCSVFPDEAVLPSPAGGAAAGGGSGAGAALGVGGDPGVAGTTAGSSTVSPLAGGAAGADSAAGAGPAAGGEACAKPVSIDGTAQADAWIEAADPAVNHGSEPELFVTGGGQPRRALVQVNIPALPVGAALLGATLVLSLQANADVSLASRLLTVHLLAQPVDEQRVTWVDWGKGNRHWTAAGADFGAALDTVTLEAGTAPDQVRFDVTAQVSAAVEAGTTSLPFIVLEKGAPPPAPAELAFSSREGDALQAPALSIAYCAP